MDIFPIKPSVAEVEQRIKDKKIISFLTMAGGHLDLLWDKSLCSNSSTSPPIVCCVCIAKKKKKVGIARHCKTTRWEKVLAQSVSGRYPNQRPYVLARSICNSCYLLVSELN